MERRQMERGHIRKREEEYDMYGEETYMKRGQTRRGDYIRKKLYGKGTIRKRDVHGDKIYKEEIT